MIITHKNRTYSVNIDWLSFTMISKVDISKLRLNLPKLFSFQKFKGTSQYRIRYCIYDFFKHKFLTILMRPVNDMIDARSIFVEVANEYLYNGRLYEVEPFIRRLFPCDFNNISRLDLACDFEPRVRQQQIIKGLFNGNYRVQNKHEGSDWWKGDRQPNQLNWGSHKSQFRWKLYDKSRELKVGTKEPEKPYIINEWIAAEFDIRFVWRLEVSITGCSKFNLFGDKLWLNTIIMPDVYVRIFIEMLERRFIVKKQENHSRKSNDKTFVFIDLGIEATHMELREAEESKPYFHGLTEFYKLSKLLHESDLAKHDRYFFWAIRNQALRICKQWQLETHIFNVHRLTPIEFLYDGLEFGNNNVDADVFLNDGFTL